MKNNSYDEFIKNLHLVVGGNQPSDGESIDPHSLTRLLTGH